MYLIELQLLMTLSDLYRLDPWAPNSGGPPTYTHCLP